MHGKKSNISQIILSVVALLLISIIAFGTTFSWIEGGTKLTIRTADGSPVKTSAQQSVGGTITLNPDTDKQINLLTYDETSGYYRPINGNVLQNVYFSPVSSSNGGDFYFPISGTGDTTVFRKGNTNDVGTKYISFEFDVVAEKKCYLSFSAQPSITITDGTGDTILDSCKSAFRVSFGHKSTGSTKDFETRVFSTDPKTGKLYNASTGAVADSGASVAYTNFIDKTETNHTKLLSLDKGDKKTIRVSVWLDWHESTTGQWTENGSTQNFPFGRDVKINLNLNVGQEKFKANFVSVTYDTAGTTVINENGGKILVDGKEASNVWLPLGTTVTATAEKNEGYEFVGWYTDKACTNAATVDSNDSTKLSANSSSLLAGGEVTYYAKFRKDVHVTTIYIEPRDYTNYYIYAYGANDDKTADGSTKIIVNRNNFNYQPNLYIYEVETETKITGNWPGVQLTSTEGNNYYLTLAEGTLDPSKNYRAIVSYNGGSQVPTDDKSSDIKNNYSIHVGYEQTFVSDKISINSTHYTGAYPGTKATYDSETGFYKLTFEAAGKGEFFAILNNNSDKRYPASGLPGVRGELGGTYLFTSETNGNKLVEFDASQKISCSVSSTNSNGGSVYIDTSGTTSVSTYVGMPVHIVATPKDSSYEFAGWYTDSACSDDATIGDDYLNPDQYVSAIDGTYYAKFVKKVVYLSPNSNWTQANARFAIYVYKGSSNQWVSMTKVSGTDYYQAEIPDGNWSTIIFVRMDPSTTANNWDHDWNQTNDLTMPTDGTNLYTIASGAWSKGGGSWSTYTPK